MAKPLHFLLICNNFENEKAHIPQYPPFMEVGKYAEEKSDLPAEDARPHQ